MRRAGTPNIFAVRSAHLTYQLEKSTKRIKAAQGIKVKELNEAKAETYDVMWPVEGGKVEPRKFNYQQLNDLFTSIMTSKAKLVAQRGTWISPPRTRRKN